MIETARNLFFSLFAADSIWSVIFRALIWLGITIVVMISMDSANQKKVGSRLRSNLGLFLTTLFLACGLIYLLFSFTGQQA